jgi:hypothetical protein
MYLVTFGNISWQKRKINQIKELSKYFNNRHRIFLEKDKESALDFLKNKNGEVIIINDKPEESLKMADVLKKKFRKASRLFVLKSVYSKNSKYKGKIYSDLREVINGLFAKNIIKFNKIN